MSHNGNTEEIEVDLPDDVLFQLMLAAHKRDITLNQLVNDILREQLNIEKERT
jgi:predicted HicB family RNase H-like nuclease